MSSNSHGKGSAQRDISDRKAWEENYPSFGKETDIESDTIECPVLAGEMMVTQELLRELFDYREDGNLIHRKSVGRVSSGSVAGTLNNNGYVHIAIDTKRHQAHRLIFLWHHGWLPPYVDHIEGKSNRIDNLRASTLSENQKNRAPNTNSTSEYKGVCWSKSNRKWKVQYTHNGKLHYVGYFTDEISAAKAYDEATRELHGEFARPNFPEGETK